MAAWTTAKAAKVGRKEEAKAIKLEEKGFWESVAAMSPVWVSSCSKVLTFVSDWFNTEILASTDTGYSDSLFTVTRCHSKQISLYILSILFASS